MKQLNYIKLEFLAKSVNEGFARTAAAAFALQLDPTLEELGDIKTAVSEAVTNAIVHAYPHEMGKVYVRLRLLEGNVLEITVRDKGCGIPDVPQAMERSGMGFTIMDSFMDGLRVRSAPGKGTTVTMSKRIKVRG
jgi:stage II sporulation protein AB (anti-sigma F factor)